MRLAMEQWEDFVESLRGFPVDNDGTGEVGTQAVFIASRKILLQHYNVA